MMPLQKFLGETLARLQLRRGLRRTKHRPSAPRELIHHAQSERQFRADHGQIRLQPRRQAHDRIQALQIGGQAFRVVRNSAVPGRAIKLRNARRLPQLPHQRMLAPAAA